METPSGQYVKRRVGLPSIYSPGIAAQWYATAERIYDLPIASMMDFEASFMTFRARETNHIKLDVPSSAGADADGADLGNISSAAADHFRGAASLKLC